MPPRTGPSVLLLVLALTACVGGNGTVHVVLEAEGAIGEGIPAQPGEGFQDGWSLTFSRYLVNVGGITLADSQGQALAVPAALSGGTRVFNLLAADTQDLFTLTGVEARRYDLVGFRSRPVDGAAEFSDRVPPADRGGMMGVSTWITATAVQGTRRVQIDWRFRDGWQFSNCQGPSGRPGAGIVVVAGATTTVRVTFHGDHWFWQSLGIEGSPTRFDPLADADTSRPPFQGNGDGLVTLDELDRVFLADVPAMTDGEFNPAGRPASTLGDYLRWSTGTNGHLDGDGVCSAARLP